jgi:aryl-alcohol dehydrogenase-like predicted oxidoreductase
MTTMQDLPMRTLGRTGLQVTQLGYGAMELRDAPRGPAIDEAQAEAVLQAVLDGGINYMDTSIDYGLSEERIGRYLGRRRSEYILASKCGCVVGPQPAVSAGGRQPHVFTRGNVIAGVEQSLQRLQTDYLDVVQFHISPITVRARRAWCSRSAARPAAPGQSTLRRHVRNVAEFARAD